MFWIVSAPTSGTWTPGSADAGTEAAIAAPAKPSVTAPTTPRLLSLVARWPSHPDPPVRVIGGLENIGSLPLIGAYRAAHPTAARRVRAGPDRHSGGRPSSGVPPGLPPVALWSAALTSASCAATAP